MGDIQDAQPDFFEDLRTQTTATEVLCPLHIPLSHKIEETYTETGERQPNTRNILLNFYDKYHYTHAKCGAYALN